MKNKNRYKKIFIISAICLLISCSQKSKTEESSSETLKKDSVSLKVKTPLPEKADKILVGAKIEGDFDGDGKNEFAIVTKTKTGEGNPIEDGTPDEYTISFSNTSLNPIIIGCCEAQLINEGDLNQDGKDEFSVFQAPMNGCTYSMTTYSLENANWKQVIEPFLISTGCDGYTFDDLQNRIFNENKTVFKLETDPNDENLKLFRKKIDLK